MQDAVSASCHGYWTSAESGTSLTVVAGERDSDRRFPREVRLHFRDYPEVIDRCGLRDHDLDRVPPEKLGGMSIRAVLGATGTGQQPAV
ncbi:MAG TPA: hypothetical protein VMM54_11785 [Nitrospirota bacterium]|nr:hypothetical protein [Nitrospirota bacterium]